MNTNKKTLLCNILLIFAASIWGANFIFQKLAATEIGPFLFMGCRCILGAITMIPIIFVLDHSTPPEQRTVYTKESFRLLLRRALLCGVTSVTGSVLVQRGLIYTTASKAGFLNAIYIIFVPIVGMLFFRKKPTYFMWFGIVLATIGLYNLCLDETLTINRGDLIVLSSVLFFSFHIQLIARFVQEMNGVHLVCAEFFFASIYCLICSLIMEESSPAVIVSQIYECRYGVLFAGILGIGVCYVLQVYAQKYTDPTVAALLMSLESVFGALGGVFVLHESFTPKELTGVLFIASAVVIAQLNPPRRRSGENMKSRSRNLPRQTDHPQVCPKACGRSHE